MTMPDNFQCSENNETNDLAEAASREITSALMKDEQQVAMAYANAFRWLTQAARGEVPSGGDWIWHGDSIGCEPKNGDKP